MDDVLFVFNALKKIVFQIPVFTMVYDDMLTECMITQPIKGIGQ